VNRRAWLRASVLPTPHLALRIGPSDAALGCAHRPFRHVWHRCSGQLSALTAHEKWCGVLPLRARASVRAPRSRGPALASRSLELCDDLRAQCPLTKINESKLCIHRCQIEFLVSGRGAGSASRSSGDARGRLLRSSSN